MGRLPAEETERINAKIRLLYEVGLGCRKIGQVIDLDPAAVYKRLKRMGFNRSIEVHQEHIKVATSGNLFSRQPSDENLRVSALGIAIQWFLERGYISSIPVEPTRYDLVVESDEGLKRVQVKSATSKNNGKWHAHISRSEYQGVSSKYTRRRKRVAYSSAEVDLFFVVVPDGGKYLIPVSSVDGLLALNLDDKYSLFRV